MTVHLHCKNLNELHLFSFSHYTHARTSRIVSHFRLIYQARNFLHHKLQREYKKQFASLMYKLKNLECESF